MKKWQRLCKQSNKFGKSWYTGLEAGGKPIYTYTKGGVVKGAGYMNMTVEEMIIKYGLNDRYEIDKLWKNK